MICACSLNPVERIKPPDLLLQDCYAPDFAGETYGDLVLHVVELREAIGLCNNDKAALRQWAEKEGEQ